jgi:TPR repeat protein
MMYMKGIGVQSDINQAIAAFAASSKLGNLLAGYNLAVLHLQGAVGEAKGSKSACRAAVSQLKRVAERGWATLTHAAEQFGAGEYELSLFNHMRAAEYGYEIGQSNAAWMLLEGYGYPTGSEFGGSVAVTLLSRAAEQGNSAALVRVGDSFWYGNGVSRDWARAARVYTEAARHRVPQAIFNLAYMHQHGAGVTKDLHLAKRYYDRVSEVSQESQAVANIALIGLRLQTWWENVSRKLPSGFARTGNGIVSMALFAPLQTVQLQDKDVLPVSGRKVRRGKANWFGMQSVLDVMDSIGDSLDVTLALWIAAALALVLWRRRMLRHRGLDQQDEVNNPGRNQN